MQPTRGHLPCAYPAGPCSYPCMHKQHLESPFSQSNSQRAVFIFPFSPQVHPPGTTHSYCGFLDNQTIPFVPSSMDSRWSLFAFQVSPLSSSFLPYPLGPRTKVSAFAYINIRLPPPGNGPLFRIFASSSSTHSLSLL